LWVLKSRAASAWDGADDLEVKKKKGQTRERIWKREDESMSYGRRNVKRARMRESPEARCGRVLHHFEETLYEVSKGNFPPRTDGTYWKPKGIPFGRMIYSHDEKGTKRSFFKKLSPSGNSRVFLHEAATERKGTSGVSGSGKANMP